MKSLAACALLLAACAGPSADVTLFAAASTTETVTRVARAYEAASGRTVRLSFASSGGLARQILAGAPADLYLSAAPAWVRALQDKGLVREHLSLLGNRLVLVAPEGQDRVEQARAGRLALADPEHAPAGIYARQALMHLGWWEAWQARVVPCADVREALQFVARGEVEGAVVYATDAVIAARVQIVYEFPESSHEEIRYPLALLTSKGEEFYRFLGGPEARAIFDEAGFRP